MEMINRFVEYIRSVKILRVALLIAIPMFLMAIVVIAVSDSEISACVNNKTGSVRIINFLGGQCTKNETSVVWNKEGIQGSKGDTGEQGLQGEVGLPGKNGVTGAGNIAFTYHYQPWGLNLALTTDGRVWEWNHNGDGNWRWKEVTSYSCNVPVSTSKIVQWQLLNFVDDEGNVWAQTGSSFCSGNWQNTGHPIY